MLSFIRRQNDVLDKRYYEDYSNREKIMEKVLKINEELGELCDEIAKKFGNQRKEKMEIENEISHEIADVLICVLLLTNSLNINVEKGLEEKILKIKKRFAEEWDED